MRVPCAVVPLLVVAAAASACRASDKPSEVAAAVQEAVSSQTWTADAEVRKDVLTFYEARAFEPVWVDGKHPQKRAGEALLVIRQAADHGLPPDDYGESAIVQLQTAISNGDAKAPEHVTRLAELETRITTALLRLGRDVALGRTHPAAVARHWKARREPPDFVLSLQTAIDRSVAGWLDQLRPRHTEYAALQKALADLRGQQEKGGWPAVPAGTFTLGKAHRSVIALRQRLAAGGLLDNEDATDSPVFDETVQNAVRAFQELHAIKGTGKVDAATRAAMNVSIADRLRQVARNLERWRWMPDDLGERHLLVNIPYFHVVAREHSKTVMDIRAVVGTPENRTPIFSDEMETVVFSPYWYIPNSIKFEETAPAAMRDPAYLDRNNIEVFRGSRPVDVAQVNWADEGELEQLTFRQRPGAQNALGHVKFLFPNDFDVYLHDTPADSLFERTGRAFSHGCVRVEEPEVLARYLLRDQPEWDAARIREAMHSGTERHVKLSAPVPVHLTYFTAWVDENGGLHFQPDVYGYDKLQASDFEDPRVRSETTARAARTLASLGEGVRFAPG